ncbi:MAG: glycoside hydrolase family 5 protein [Granulosicoccus sp.]
MNQAVTATRDAFYTRFLRVVMVSVLMALTFVGLSRAWAQELNLEPNNWELFSVPGQSSQSIDALFADSFDGQVAGSTWGIFELDAQTQVYRQLQGQEPLRPGTGFWMIQIGDSPVSVQLPARANPAGTSSAACQATACLEQPLPTGVAGRWSLIGTPANTPLSFDAISVRTDGGVCTAGCSLSQAAAQGMTTGELYTYDSAGGQYSNVSDGGALTPGKGYWFSSRLTADMGTADLLLPVPGNNNTDDIFAKAARLGRGMNLGNALEAPEEGLWGLTLESYFFDRIAEAGFDSVRVPIRWSVHAGNAAPYTIDPEFFVRVDWVVAQAKRNNLAVVLNVHHYEALMASPATERTRYLALWEQIAQRYAAESDDVFFELLNEPTERFNDEPALWNSLLVEAVDVVRQSNPDRALIVGPVGWNAINRLPDFQLPEDDQLIATVHFYSPFAFTHQGATWVDPVPPEGATFDPDLLGLGGAFQDWSWDTTWASVANGTRISYQRQYAGFNLRKQVAGRFRQMTLNIVGPAQLSVTCGDNGTFEQVGQIDQVSAASEQHVVDLSSCPQATGNVVLQNQTPSASSFILQQGELCTADSCYAVFENAGDALASELQAAADWGSRNNLPVYVGEFGAYGTGDLTSRAAWTRTVQSAINDLGMTSAYWEFGAGFGAFDIASDSWNDRLLDALLLR